MPFSNDKRLVLGLTATSNNQTTKQLHDLLNI